MKGLGTKIRLNERRGAVLSETYEVGDGKTAGSLQAK